MYSYAGAGTFLSTENNVLVFLRDTADGRLHGAKHETRCVAVQPGPLIKINHLSCLVSKMCGISYGRLNNTCAFQPSRGRSGQIDARNHRAERFQSVLLFEVIHLDFVDVRSCRCVYLGIFLVQSGLQYRINMSMPKCRVSSVCFYLPVMVCSPSFCVRGSIMLNTTI